MTRQNKFKKARNQLVFSGLILVFAMIGWYMALYRPVSAKNVELRAAIESEQDSMVAIERYKAQALALEVRMEKLNQEIEEWDASFPPRRDIVSLAKQFILFFNSYGIELIEMQPSLFELYALERAGNIIAGEYVSKQLFSMILRGRYLNLGRMLEQIDTLPFKVTVSNLEMEVLREERPELEIKLDMFLYVHQ